MAVCFSLAQEREHPQVVESLGLCGAPDWADYTAEDLWFSGVLNMVVATFPGDLVTPLTLVISLLWSMFPQSL